MRGGWLNGLRSFWGWDKGWDVVVPVASELAFEFSAVS